MPEAEILRKRLMIVTLVLEAATEVPKRVKVCGYHYPIIKCHNISINMLLNQSLKSKEKLWVTNVIQ